MFPGKGAHLVLNEEILNFINSCVLDVKACYTDEQHDKDPARVIAVLTDEDATDKPWTKEKDNFGHKAYRSMPYKKGELRVTVVLTKRGELKFDVREWYKND